MNLHLLQMPGILASKGLNAGNELAMPLVTTLYDSHQETEAKNKTVDRTKQREEKAENEQKKTEQQRQKRQMTVDSTETEQTHQTHTDCQCRP